MARDVVERVLALIERQTQTVAEITEVVKRRDHLLEEIEEADATIEELSVRLTEVAKPVPTNGRAFTAERPVGRRQGSTKRTPGYKAATTRRKLQTTPSGRDYVLFALSEVIGNAETVEELFNSAVRLGYKPRGGNPIHTFRMAVRAQRVKGFVRQVPRLSPKRYQLTAAGRKEAQRLQKQFGWTTEGSARVPVA